MRNKTRVTVDNARKGMRIKVGLARWWCQVNHDSPVVWVKGKIVEVCPSKSDPQKIVGIVFSFRWKKHHYYFKESRVWTPANEDGIFDRIYQCK